MDGARPSVRRIQSPSSCDELVRAHVPRPPSCPMPGHRVSLPPPNVPVAPPRIWDVISEKSSTGVLRISEMMARPLLVVSWDPPTVMVRSSPYEKNLAVGRETPAHATCSVWLGENQIRATLGLRVTSRGSVRRRRSCGEAGGGH